MIGRGCVDHLFQGGKGRRGQLGDILLMDELAVSVVACKAITGVGSANVVLEAERR